MPTPRRSTSMQGDRLTNDTSNADPAALVAGGAVGNLAARLAAIRPAWHDEAACIGHPLDLWFPAKGQSSAPALEICGRCPSLTPCLEEAVADPTLDHGIRGGANVAARRAIRKNRQRKAAP